MKQLKANLLAETILTECPTCHRGWADEAEAGRIAAEIAAKERAADAAAATSQRLIREEARREGREAQAAATTAQIEALLRENAELKDGIDATVDAKVEQRVAANKLAAERETADLRQQLTTLQLEQANKDRRWAEEMEKLKRRAEDKSANTLGDPAQHDLARRLAEAFRPLGDTVRETRHGEKGADVFLTINDDGARRVLVVFDNKTTPGWQGGWVTKLRGDVNLHGADLGILVVPNMPARTATMTMSFATASSSARPDTPWRLLACSGRS
jgi:hypothetical protein